MATRKSRSTSSSSSSKNNAHRSNGAAKKKATTTRRANGDGRSKGAATASGSKRGARKIGYAVIGLGHIAQVAVLPAFANAKENSRLVALVSSDREKLTKVGRKYGLKKDALYAYEDLETCLAREDVDAVYIALPNDMHREYTVRAAKAGAHVLCEKPMALSSRDCDEMMRACDAAGVKLMIAYRLHFDPATLATIELVQSGKLGDLRLFESTFGFEVAEDNIRIDPVKGGGPVWDIGIYCLNAVRMIFDAEPTEVFAAAASRPDARFKDVPEAVSVVMKFPDDRLATFQCSFGVTSTGSFRVVGTKGLVELKPAYGYVGKTEQVVTVKGKEQKKSFRAGDQFAPELLDFSHCILEDEQPEPSGLEGKTDIVIIEAIHRAIETGKPVKISLDAHPPRPSPDQARHAPPVKEPVLINVEAPHE